MKLHPMVAVCATLSVLVFSLAARTEAQVQTKSQAGCISTMNKSGQKVAATQGKNISSCVKDAGKQKLPMGVSAEQCLTADLKGKLAKATSKTTASETKKCPETPDFGFTGSAITNDAGTTRETELAHDVFGNPITSAMSTDSDGAKCQSGVVKAYEKLAATFVKEFNSCKKSGLKDTSIMSTAGLEACVGSDPKNKVSGAATKLTDTITKKCATVALASEFPGECAPAAGSAATLGACLRDAVECRMCEMLNEMDGLDVPCDSFDDGVVNASCSQCGNGVVEGDEECDDGGGNSDVLADACRTSCLNAHCGDGVLDFPEACDDGNNTPGDGCDAVCSCEAGNPSPTCQEPLCPDRGQLVLYAGTTNDVCTTNVDCAVGTCDGGLGVCVTDTELDTGWKGIAHNSDTNDQVLTMGRLLCDGPFAGGPEPCGSCKVIGIDPGTGDCRCANDNRTICDEPFSADVDDCGGNTCNCYFGAALPLSSGNTPACVINRFAEDVRGTANVDLGSGEISAKLRSVVYLGINVLAPCPACGGTCTAPVSKVGTACATDINCDSAFNSGDGVCGNFDPVAGDGNRQGTCWGGKDQGLSCDIGSYNTSFPAPAGGGAGHSLDCFPGAGVNVSGTGLSINLEQTTGVSALPPADVDCGFNLAPEECPCGLCTGNTALTCTSNADCTGVGTCAKVGDGNPRQNDCADGVCTDVGGGEGECLANTPIKFCDGVTRGNGEGFVQCNTNADCSPLGSFAGNCTLSTPKRCFTDPISVAGVADPDTPVAVATFCIPPTGNSGINSVAGLPGPGRVTNSAAASTFCASNPLVQYSPGVGGCPP